MIYQTSKKYFFICEIAKNKENFPKTEFPPWECYVFVISLKYHKDMSRQLIAHLGFLQSHLWQCCPIYELYNSFTLINVAMTLSRFAKVEHKFTQGNTT